MEAFLIMVAVGLVVAFVGWIVAEFYGGRRLRIVLALLVMSALAFLVWGLMAMVQRTNEMSHQAALQYLDDVAAKGDIAAVRRAIGNYLPSPKKED